MERGFLVSAVFSRELGRPRPALVIQSGRYVLGALTLLPLTSHIQNGLSFRIDVYPTDGNGLRRRSQIMVDKPSTVDLARVGRQIGLLDETTQKRVDIMLSLFLGLA